MLHGQTQNRNKCLNSMVWKKCPKEIFVSRKLLEIGICSAVIEFNDGKSGLTPIIQVLGLHVSKFMLSAFRKRDTDRIKNIQRKSLTKAIKMKRKLRAIRKGFLDKEKENDIIPAYSAGSYKYNHNVFVSLILFLYFSQYLIFSDFVNFKT